MPDNAAATSLQPLPLPTDRDIMAGLMEAVLGLAEKLTGERMTVHVRTESGHTVSVVGGNVTWEKVANAASSGQHADMVDLLKASIFEARRANASLSAILNVISHQAEAPKSLSAPRSS